MTSATGSHDFRVNVTSKTGNFIYKHGTAVGSSCPPFDIYNLQQNCSVSWKRPKVLVVGPFSGVRQGK